MSQIRKIYLSAKSISNTVKTRASWRVTRKDNLRVSVVTQFFPPDFAATGQILDLITQELTKCGMQIQIFTGMPSYAFVESYAERIEFSHNRYIRRSKASRFWPHRIRGRILNGFLFSVRTVIRLIRESRRGDLLVYTSEPAYLPIFGYVLSFICSTPYMLILYDLYPNILPSLGVLRDNSIIIRFWRFANKHSFSSAQTIIVLSEPMKECILRDYPALDPSKVRVIPSCSDHRNIKPLGKDSNWFAQKYHLENKFVVMYSGNQGRCHDLVTVVATALLLREDKDVIFMFIGGGAQNRRIRELRNEWNLQNCLFLPYQVLSDLPYSLSAADVAVVSLAAGTEALVAPSKLYGHLAAGTPIAAILNQL